MGYPIEFIFEANAFHKLIDFLNFRKKSELDTAKTCKFRAFIFETYWLLYCSNQKRMVKQS